MKRNKLVGRRIIKTAISVFITAIICLYLGLPAEFAIIAAIVTVEPTASDSLKRGLIRLPASAIGAAFAVMFVAFFGESAIAYTLAAIFTIFVCQRLKLHAGILVATLTAVAMIPDINGHYLLSFISRLGTTATGLIVSSIVNFTMLHPKYNPLIEEKLNPNIELTRNVLQQTMDRIVELKHATAPSAQSNYIKLRRSIEKISELIMFQEKEWKYRRVKLSEYRSFKKLKRVNTIVQKLVLHLGNLQYVNEPGYFNEREKDLVLKVTKSITNILKQPRYTISDHHYALIHDLDQTLKYESNHMKKSDEYFHHFTTKRIVYFQLLSIHDSLEELERLYQKNEGSDHTE
ncbi:aromatic acid exporter family protein [Evansella halocellulosilytica]|uniref:aromatic acid exporter family protein n=1 Tax=Evansella halocellulosilytica TaxID=2011013 RepID=UPI000BB8781B|nr:aromatic acid exporter family protein [Evansella halocellulosilytica]